MIVGIIPSRYASTRFPGKPLVKIGSKSMIQRVYEKASQALNEVYVATDDSGIFREVESFGGKAVLTSPHHQSGTDRCAEAIELIKENNQQYIEAVINIQGDEPFIDPNQIKLLIDCFLDVSTEIATLVRPFTSIEDILNSNYPKVVLNKKNEAIYFSRSPIPFVRNHQKESWIQNFRFLQHIGIYGYRIDTLKEITNLPQSLLEIAESLEQNRWIENGYRIMTAETAGVTISIDTPEDILKIPPELID
jgi:3-deoxy-manno-octulosonate cytidylyltransferase (CMP-KDO synthetase)